MLARYTYDAWGRPLTITDANGNDVSSNPNHIANINPIRYRGYYFDKETGLYYLQSRYYDPSTGRFLNADGHSDENLGILGMNLFLYCGNNPINYIDLNGEFAAAVGAVAAGSAAIPGFGWVVAGAILTVAAVVGAVTLASEATWGNTALQLPQIKRKNNIIPFPPVVPSPSREPQPVPAPKSDKNEKPKGNVYYHVTTPQNAMLIWASGALVGSSYEGGYVFAWKSKPSQKAIKLSGARYAGAIISFRTNAAFERDPGIDDSYLLRFGPVRSCSPGPITIWDIKVLR